MSLLLLLLLLTLLTLILIHHLNYSKGLGSLTVCCEFCEIFKNTFFTEHVRVTALALPFTFELNMLYTTITDFILKCFDRLRDLQKKYLIKMEVIYCEIRVMELLFSFLVIMDFSTKDFFRNFSNI